MWAAAEAEPSVACLLGEVDDNSGETTSYEDEHRQDGPK
jgi:hypothetical protein